MGLENINRLRKAMGMSIEELSKRSGLPRSTVSKLTAGISTNPNLDTIKALARALNCNLAVFDDEEEEGVNMPFSRELKEREEQTVLLRCYERINLEGKKKLVDYADDLVASGHYTPGEEKTEYYAVARNGGKGNGETSVRKIHGKKFDPSKVEGLKGDKF